MLQACFIMFHLKHSCRAQRYRAFKHASMAARSVGKMEDCISSSALAVVNKCQSADGKHGLPL